MCLQNPCLRLCPRLLPIWKIAHLPFFYRRVILLPSGSSQNSSPPPSSVSRCTPLSKVLSHVPLEQIWLWHKCPVFSSHLRGGWNRLSNSWCILNLHLCYKWVIEYYDKQGWAALKDFLIHLKHLMYLKFQPVTHHLYDFGQIYPPLFYLLHHLNKLFIIYLL